jgi:hypothetical protein
MIEEIDPEVEFKIYDGMPHTVNEDEIERVRVMLAQIKRSNLVEGAD